MYRIIGMTALALAALVVPVETSLAFGSGSGTGKIAASIMSVTPTASQGAPKGSTSTASPNVKKLSPKGGAACFRACMHGMDSSWGNFCDYSCYGG
jgi:hypothetical protein